MLTFDQQIKTHNGWVAGLQIIPIKHNLGANTKVTKKKTQISTSMKTYACMENVNDLHRALGHPSEAITRAMGSSMGIKVVGKFEPGEACILEKAKQRKINKIAVEHSTVPGERLYLDISLPNTVSLSGKKHWLRIVDYSTGYAYGAIFSSTKEKS